MQNVKDLCGIVSSTNGPQGTVAAKTITSLSMRIGELEYLQRLIPNYDIYMSSCLTLRVESFHAISHFKDDTQTVLQYVRNISNIVKVAAASIKGRKF